MPVGELHDLPPLRSRARHACRILEIRDDVEELRHANAPVPVRAPRYRVHRLRPGCRPSRAVAAQQRERPVVRRRLGEDRVAGLQQAQAEELNQLKRSVAREDAVDC